MLEAPDHFLNGDPLGHDREAFYSSATLIWCSGHDGLPPRSIPVRPRARHPACASGGMEGAGKHCNPPDLETEISRGHGNRRNPYVFPHDDVAGLLVEDDDGRVSTRRQGSRWVERRLTMLPL